MDDSLAIANSNSLDASKVTGIPKLVVAGPHRDTNATIDSSKSESPDVQNALKSQAPAKVGITGPQITRHSEKAATASLTRSVALAKQRLDSAG